MSRTMLSMAVAAVLAAAAPAASAQPGSEAAKISDGVVKIGLLLDMSSLYADITGEGSVTAARMAIEDFGGKVLGAPIELVFADHQNKPDIASAKAREWFAEEKVDMLGDVAASATALAALEIAKQMNRIAIFNGPGSPRITNENCTPISVHYTYDTHALATSTGRGVLETGGDTWFFLTADYTFGTSLQKDTTEVIKAGGGRVLGSVRHPLNTQDFSSFLLQAQSSKAEILGLANAGGDTINSIKAANEFGITKTMKLAGLLVFINDVHTLSLEVAQGMLLTEAYYWDRDEGSRAFARRFFERMKKMPNMSQAGVYSSAMHYLKAVEAAGTDETAAVMRAMKSAKINDIFAKGGFVRGDGRMIHDMYLFEVKKPSESKYRWDYYNVKATVPGEQAFLPVEQSACPLLKKK
ncbi:MAG: ABC transporter substrate-binding protein [Gammaproteobacteria bacterium]